ncbi:MAG TPA: glycosyltransferase family 4 protein [Anaerolineaceae bacterium]|nr:glycosyltransferase family 4 protein [Anaerolineaceae bacterium]
MTIPVRLGVVQRVLPTYRTAFFDALAAVCPEGLGVFAGQPRAREMIAAANGMQLARLNRAQNRHLFNGPAYLCLQQGLLVWLANWQPGVLILEANPRYLSSPAAVRWMHRRGRGVIGWGLGSPQLGGGLRRWLRRQFLAQFDAVISYSRAGRTQYAALGLAADRIFVAPNAVMPRPTHPLPDRANPTGPLTVLFVGRLQPRKRIDLLLRACAALPADLKPHLRIVGDGPARAELGQLAAELYPAAEFLGARHGAELAPVFAAADLLVLPGTGGLAVQEAMTFGLPVIAAEGDGTQDDLVRPENGWRVQPGDLAALTSTLAGALGAPARLRRMGAESYRIVATEINLEQMVAGFEQAVHFVLEQRQCTP